MADCCGLGGYFIVVSVVAEWGQIYLSVLSQGRVNAESKDALSQTGSMHPEEAGSIPHVK